jgi:hypothetical protein
MAAATVSSPKTSPQRPKGLLLVTIREAISGKLVKIQSPHRGQFSPAADTASVAGTGRKSQESLVASIAGSQLPNPP